MHYIEKTEYVGQLRASKAVEPMLTQENEMSEKEKKTIAKKKSQVAKVREKGNVNLALSREEKDESLQLKRCTKKPS